MHPASSATIGPFFPRHFFQPGDNDLTRLTAEAAPTARGEAILIRGRVTRLDGVPCVNAILEAWQADAGGRFNHPDDPERALADPDFLGWGRAWTDAGGGYEFRTVMPGGYRDPAGPRAPHVNLTIMASGLMRNLATTLFFPGVGADPVLEAVPRPLRPLLVATPAGEADGLRVFRFDIRLRGEGETPFFTD